MPTVKKIAHRNKQLLFLGYKILSLPHWSVLWCVFAPVCVNEIEVPRTFPAGFLRAWFKQINPAPSAAKACKSATISAAEDRARNICLSFRVAFALRCMLAHVTCGHIWIRAGSTENEISDLTTSAMFTFCKFWKKLEAKITHWPIL